VSPAGAPARPGATLRGRTPAWRFTGRADGDLSSPVSGVERAGVERRRRAVAALPWTWLRQVHGAEVITVTRPGQGAGTEADAAVTAVPGAALAVLTADCAPVVLTSAEGVVGVAHAGWRGLLAGVLEATVAAMRELGAGPVVAHLGPCIHAGCYEFGIEDLAEVASRVGPAAVGTASSGRPALDLPAAVAADLSGAGVALEREASRCTACAPRRYFTWRGAGDRGRQAGVVWT